MYCLSNFVPSQLFQFVPCPVPIFTPTYRTIFISVRWDRVQESTSVSASAYRYKNLSTEHFLIFYATIKLIFAIIIEY